MMIYVIPKDDDKPIKIVFKGGEGSNPIVEDDQVYFIDEHPSPEEVGKAFRTLYERLMSIEEEVFEKQIPKMPYFGEALGYKGFNGYLCPICRNWLLYPDEIPNSRDSFCSFCGQKIDWSEVEK